MAIVAIFFLQCTWFVAWLALDQRRIEAGRDGFLPCCLIHSDFKPSAFSRREWGRAFMSELAGLIESSYVKVRTKVRRLSGIMKVALGL